MDNQLKPNEYCCAMCGNVYEKGLSDEEAMHETQSYWPDVQQEECAIVCDDCYQMIKPEEFIEKLLRKELGLNYN